MSQPVTLLKRTAFDNPATRPALTEALRRTVARQRQQVVDLLRSAIAGFGEPVFANSFGAEDMVLTDIIATEALPVRIFSLDTGRLPTETYALMAATEARYGLRLAVFFPRHEAVEDYVRQYGINAFYNTVELRKTCCHMRKVEPLQRALAGRRAWITGMRAAQSATRAELPIREFDTTHGLEKFNPLAAWSEQEVWAYIRLFDVPYNALHDQFYPSIGCAPCTRAIAAGEDIRAGRWWWEDAAIRECGLHIKE